MDPLLGSFLLLLTLPEPDTPAPPRVDLILLDLNLPEYDGTKPGLVRPRLPAPCGQAGAMPRNSTT